MPNWPWVSRAWPSWVCRTTGSTSEPSSGGDGVITTQPTRATHLGSCGGLQTAACLARTRTQSRLPCSRTGPHRRSSDIHRCLGREKTPLHSPVNMVGVLGGNSPHGPCVHTRLPHPTTGRKTRHQGSHRTMVEAPERGEESGPSPLTHADR